MELKTKVMAMEGKQDIRITREFDLPVNLLFRAYTEPEIVEQWMGTKVLKLHAEKHGSYLYESTDPKGRIHGFNGVIHDLIPGKKIIRTFDMENGNYGVQLEFFEFEKLSEETSRLHKQIIFRSKEERDEILKLPFEQGINMAHNRLQDIVSKLI